MAIYRSRISWGILTLSVILLAVMITFDTSSQPPVERDKTVSIQPQEALPDKPSLDQKKDAPKPSAESKPEPESESKPKEDIGYQVIIQNNLFKPLGTTDEKPGPSFRLAGIYSKGQRTRALIEEGNRLHDLAVGDEFSQGYKLTAIEDGEAKVDGADGALSLALSGWIPTGGKASHSPARPRPGPAAAKGKAPAKAKGQPSRSEVSGPPAGMRGKIQEILKKEGVTMQEVMQNPELRRRLMSQYGPGLR